MAETKYGGYLVPLEITPLNGGGSGSEGWGLRGKALRGLEVHMFAKVHKEVGRMNPERQTKPHGHAFDEVLLFFGSDTDNMGKLGGEVEMRMGREEEKHIITVPTAVVVPRGLLHTPITFLKVDKPLYFMDISLAASRPFHAELDKIEAEKRKA